jgi:chromosome segregation ATPase
MTRLSAVVVAVLTATAPAAAATETPAIVVEAADSPVKIGRATVLTVAGDPPVVLYAATNQTAEDFEQFTVMVFIFDAKGTLKFEHMAPGRRMLEGKSTKYSTIVLDGDPVDPAGSIVIGVNQVQRVSSEVAWRADLRAAAEAAVSQKK